MGPEPRVSVLVRSTEYGVLGARDLSSEDASDEFWIRDMETLISDSIEKNPEQKSIPQGKWLLKGTEIVLRRSLHRRASPYKILDSKQNDWVAAYR